MRLYERALSADEVFGNYKYDYGRFIGNNEILLVQSAENSSNGTTSCSLTLENCTVGNTLILAYAIRGSGNNPTLTDGWEKVGGGNVDADDGDLYHKLYFAKKKAENTTETITLTQTTTGRIYLVCGEFSGNFNIVMRNDMANIGSGDYKVTASKRNPDDVILYGVTSSIYQIGTGRGQKCEPSDLTKLQGNDTQERLACWFDNGNGALSHTFTTVTYSSINATAIVECVQLIPKKSKYLIRNSDIIYTVQNNSLVEVVGDLNAQLFIDNGVDTIPDGTLLMTLSNPEILCWADSDRVPTLTTTVQGTPFPQTLMSSDYDMTHPSILGIEKVTVDATNGVLFAVSFDSGESWKIWTGQTWGELSEENTGMSAEIITSITSEQWNEVATTGKFRFRVILSTIEDKFKSLIVDYVNV